MSHAWRTATRSAKPEPSQRAASSAPVSQSPAVTSPTATVAATSGYRRSRWGRFPLEG